MTFFIKLFYYGVLYSVLGTTYLLVYSIGRAIAGAKK